ncbi:hypothetical protein AYL99_11480 [Fonsecaea erecta]|uniref:Uncharacterized protein n=1 Tax=Fonsecaea erecta TaxID=1367422 RepID=A0A178Z3R4_9EURO|nr:hypothetical protein AYL99_11480 [Fonsecaea erecta]OAP54379.1 hypothetical protein AYL99_11480 [Fonsecaea erecta]
MTSRLLTHFRKKKAKVGNRPIVWNPAELQDIFFDTIQFNSRTPVEIFVDARDERKEEEVRTIIATFEGCAAATVGKGSQNLKICWSGRHDPHISIENGFEIRVELENLGDISFTFNAIWPDRTANNHFNLCSSGQSWCSTGYIDSPIKVFPSPESRKSSMTFHQSLLSSTRRNSRPSTLNWQR